MRRASPKEIDVDPGQFFADTTAEMATNRFDRVVIIDLLQRLKAQGVVASVRLTSRTDNYSDTLVLKLPKKITPELVVMLLQLQPDEGWLEKTKLVLWWD